VNVIRSIARRSVGQLTRSAAVLALLGLGIMAYSIVSPRPLPVILAMSVGHGIGAAAVLCYVLAIVLHASRGAAAQPPEMVARGLEEVAKREAQRSSFNDQAD